MIVGIDLGTTNSAVARWVDGRPALIPNSLGDVLTPSAVSLTDDGDVLVGMAARERQSVHPGRTATAFKRLMGTHAASRRGEPSTSPIDVRRVRLSRRFVNAMPPGRSYSGQIARFHLNING